MPIQRAGLVMMTELVKHCCRLITTYSDKMQQHINAAVLAGSITSAQATTLKAWIDALDGICLILRAITGY